MKRKMKLACAAVIGRGHENTGQPCQDSVIVKKLGKITGLAALADGAGSASRAHIGAEYILKTLLRMIENKLSQVSFQDSEPWKNIVGEIREQIKSLASDIGIEEQELASTLLFVLSRITRRGVKYCAGHIGDGLIIMQVNGQCYVLSHPFQGEFANSTVFITTETVEKNLRLYMGEEKGNVGFLLISDGTARVLYNKRTGDLAPACSNIFSWANKLSSKEMEKIIRKNLNRVFRLNTNDDCSICLMKAVGLKKEKRGWGKVVS